ncbi:MAG: tRNA 2-thiouridine(34) synthase MnmA [Pseudomonadota bacterium]|nr:tRNA 2-thiouridine(34) synthase MnmA [Pseudomonadota bacterium]
MTIAVALSGGVDSTIAAVALIEAGETVIGLTLELGDDPGARAAIEDAAAVCARLHIPHHIVPATGVFRDQVIGPFIADYATGRTPNPCIHCNRAIKFGLLMERAEKLGADRLATGHYARIAVFPDGPALCKASDADHDQSYFLFAIPRERLARIVFPLGEITKTDVRKIAKDAGLPTAHRPDSQDICFVDSGDSYTGLVTSACPRAGEAGDIVDMKGHVLGRHKGLAHYTIGQRRGLGIAAKAPLYVIALDVAANSVIVGPMEALARRRIDLSVCNWLIDPPTTPRSAMAKLRATQRPVPATVIALQGGSARVETDIPVSGIAPGQAGVLYDGDRVLGGGWIENSEQESGAG